MKKIIILFFFLFNFKYVNAEINIAYIDINYILNNSIVGKSISEHIKSIEKKKTIEFDLIESNLSKKDKDIIAKKNILEENEFQKQVDELKNEIKKYRTNKTKFINEVNEKKMNYTKLVLNSLNDIIAEYVEKNSITIVLPKKNIVVAKKNLSITEEIMKILNNKLSKIEF